MKTYMNWFLSGGVVLSLTVVTLLFNKLSALDGRLAAMEMALSGSHGDGRTSLEVVFRLASLEQRAGRPHESEARLLGSL